MMPLYSKGGLYKMKKRMIQLMALALVALGVVSGCSAKAQLPTEIGSFAVVDVSMVDTYDTLQAESGQKLCIIAMKPNDAIQEDKYKSYFCSDDGSSVAKITISGTEYNCMAVAVQGMPNDKSVEYTLVFEVPESASTAGSLSLTAPNLTPVEIKY